jgi:hypothetical protein
VREVRLERFRALPSTYQPFALAFAAAFTGSLLSLFFRSTGILALAAMLNALGVLTMLAETEFAPSWARWLLPKAESQNVCGRIAPSKEVRGRVVLSAHIDSHRTPIFYSTTAWTRLFSTLIAATFLSMLLGALGFALAAALGWQPLYWLGILTAPVQAFALAMCLQADFTP